ncbi:unnamed protein product, partial [Arabidopsis halleri]
GKLKIVCFRKKGFLQQKKLIMEIFWLREKKGKLKLLKLDWIYFNALEIFLLCKDSKALANQA